MWLATLGLPPGGQAILEMNRSASTQEFAATVVHSVSEGWGTITGQNFIADGRAAQSL